jgi:hypothetical protein
MRWIMIGNTNEKALELFLKTYLEALKLYASPGEKSHMLATSLHWMEKRMMELLKEGK